MKEEQNLKEARNNTKTNSCFSGSVPALKRQEEDSGSSWQ